jgi:hypothetical protein
LIGSRWVEAQDFCRRLQVPDWVVFNADRSEEIAELRYFSIKKRQAGGDVTFRITVKEFSTPPPGQHLRFFAEADKPVNQKSAPLVPCGWGDSVTDALDGCVKLIRQFPYEQT